MFIQVKYFVLGGLFANASAFLQSYGTLLRDPSALNLASILDRIDLSSVSSESSEGDILRLQRVRFLYLYSLIERF